MKEFQKNHVKSVKLVLIHFLMNQLNVKIVYETQSAWEDPSFRLTKDIGEAILHQKIYMHV